MEQEQKITQAQRVPLILFSGGLDSTYLLFEALETTDVDILYVKGPQGDNKITCELNARENILEWLAQNRPFKVRNKDIIDISQATVTQDGKYRQILPWFFGALTIADSYKHSSVQIAYISSDGSSNHATTIGWAWDYLGSSTKNKKVDLAFPLIDVSKQDIMKRMPYELYKKIWVCEIPEKIENDVEPTVVWKHCGTCETCINKQTEEYKWSLKNQYDYVTLSENTLIQDNLKY